MPSPVVFDKSQAIALGNTETSYHYQVVHEDGFVSRLVVPYSRRGQAWEAAVQQRPGSPITGLALVRVSGPEPRKSFP
jgi:hypothetical protein